MNKLNDRLADNGFLTLGAFRPANAAETGTGLIVLVGNAGPAMFEKFSSERDPNKDTIDDWTREKLTPIAAKEYADLVFPFDKPAPPFISWAKQAGIGNQSPLGLMIHPVYGLWFAFRAAFLYLGDYHIKGRLPPSPCDRCMDKPCLTACPVSAFKPGQYLAETCRRHVRSEMGKDCYHNGCLARRACPIGQDYIYEPVQHEFHMRAFVEKWDV